MSALGWDHEAADEKILAVSFPPEARERLLRAEGTRYFTGRLVAFRRFGRSPRGFARHRIRSGAVRKDGSISVTWLCGNVGTLHESWSDDVLSPCCLIRCDGCERKADRLQRAGYREIVRKTG